MTNENLDLDLNLNVEDIEMEDASSLFGPRRNTGVTSSGCCMR
ncbi:MULTISPECIES: hypothetical protein [Lactobacillus]|nr:MULTISPECIES: hypothetical protein [Lactobacillus]